MRSGSSARRHSSRPPEIRPAGCRSSSRPADAAWTFFLEHGIPLRAGPGRVALLLVDQGRVVERAVALTLVLAVALAFLLFEELVVALVFGRLFGSVLAHARSMPGRGRLQSNGRNRGA